MTKNVNVGVAQACLIEKEIFLANGGFINAVSGNIRILFNYTHGKEKDTAGQENYSLFLTQ